MGKLKGIRFLYISRYWIPFSGGAELEGHHFVQRLMSEGAEVEVVTFHPVELDDRFEVDYKIARSSIPISIPRLPSMMPTPINGMIGTAANSSTIFSRVMRTRVGMWLSITTIGVRRISSMASMSVSKHLGSTSVVSGIHQLRLTMVGRIGLGVWVTR